MWINQEGRIVGDNEQYTGADGTTYPANFPRAEIPGLSVYEPPEPTPEELAQQAINQALAMQAAILQWMTALFDATAQARNYDNRLTCALRAGYPGPFHDEGVAFATWMDTQNAKAYALLAQVQAGTMSMPESVDAALALLDPMVWPT